MSGDAGRPIEERFTLEAAIGRGAFGEVFRGVDRETGELVAVKRLLSHRTDPVTSERFHLEARLLARVESAHVVRYVAHGLDEQGQMCLVLEWLDGEDLSRRQKHRALNQAEAIEVVRQAALGLEALHQAGIVHRDVKPSNFFLLQSPAGPSSAPGGALHLHVKLLDLGIARAAMEPTLTRAGFRIGTPAYMSPEQARGDELVTPHSDIFSLGVVLYELLSGRRPFTGNDPYAMLAKIVLQDPPPVRAVSPQVPAALEAIVMRAMAKAPEQRFPSALALAEALARVDLGHTAAHSIPPAMMPTHDMHAPPELRGTMTLGADRTTVFNRASSEPDAPRAPGVAGRDAPPSEPASAHHAARDDDDDDDDAPTALVGGARVSAIDGHRVVTAIFAGFEAGDAFVKHVTAFTSLIAAHRGVTYRTLGARAIAVYGLQRAAGDEVLRAARAALAATRVVPEVRLAMSTCRVLARTNGLAGDAIERGAAALDRAEPGAVWVDDATARLLGEHFRVDGPNAHGDRYLYNDRDPRGDARPRAAALRTPTVGRERELGDLDAIWHECVGEPVARAVLVTAPAGVGKSRLVQEFQRRLRARGDALELWTARGDPMSAGSPFGMISQLVRRAAGVREGAPLAERQQRLRARLSRHLDGEDLEPVTEFLAELIGAGFDPTDQSTQLRAARTDPILMGDQMARAWEAWLRAECEVQPVLIVLEDLQWGDVPSVRFIDAALRALPDHAFMVLALARPEVHELFPSLWAGRGVHEVRLAELTRRAAERLVRAVLGEPTSPELVARLVDRAAGNAFFLEELIRAVAEGRSAGSQPPPGAAGWTAAAQPDALPETVLAMVQARLDALGEQAGRVLRAASVFGKTFWRGGLAGLLHAPPRGGAGGRDDAVSALEPLLRELCEREVLARRAEAKFPGEEEYVFRHALLREAAYASLTDADRTRAHRLAGKWLESVGEREPMVLAEQFERGGEPARALGWYRRAAEQALEGNDFAAVLARAERGAALLEHAAQGGVVAPLAAGGEAPAGAGGGGGAEGALLFDPATASAVMGELRLLQAEANRWREAHAEAQSCALEALTHLPPGAASWFAAAGEVAAASGALGNHPQLEELALELLAVDPATDAHQAYVTAAARTVFQLIHLGYYDLADRLVARIDPVARSVARRDPAAAGWILSARARHALREGDLSEFVRLNQAAAVSFGKAGDRRGALGPLVSAGAGLVALGAYGDAARALPEVAADAEQFGLPRLAAAARVTLGVAHARLGARDEALSHLADALGAFAARADRREEGAARTWLAAVLLEAGDAAAAESEAHAAVETLFAVGPDATRAAALAVRARALLELGQVPDALVAAEAACALEPDGAAGIDATGDGAAHAGLALAEALRTSGEGGRAADAIARARTALIARAQQVSDPALRRSFLERVPEHAHTLALAAAWLAGGEPDDGDEAAAGGARRS